MFTCFFFAKIGKGVLIAWHTLYQAKLSSRLMSVSICQYSLGIHKRGPYLARKSLLYRALWKLAHFAHYILVGKSLAEQKKPMDFMVQSPF